MRQLKSIRWTGDDNANMIWYCERCHAQGDGENPDNWHLATRHRCKGVQFTDEDFW